jgi:hypothetical protein
LWVIARAADNLEETNAPQASLELAKPTRHVFPRRLGAVNRRADRLRQAIDRKMKLVNLKDPNCSLQS